MTESADAVSVDQDGKDGTKNRTSLRAWVIPVLAAALSIYVLIEVNFSLLSPLKELALFASAGLILCFLCFPLRVKWLPESLAGASDWLLSILATICCVYLIYYGSDLGQRAGIYKTSDLVIGAIGLVLVLEATRRSIGWALPILALLFVLYAHESISQGLPDWLFPHRGQDFGDLIGQTYLRTEGVFGTALGVMFRYVFLFVLFGAFLEASGATGYIIALATRLLGKKAGGPAKVAVLSSGLMGSLSGSAVANAATTGVFTIPLMRSIGFRPHIAAGIEAAASSGGALMPPVMGAGAYMMMEIINRTPAVTYLEICKAAIIPAVLYYLSIFLLVHFYAKRIDEVPELAYSGDGNGDDKSSQPNAEEVVAQLMNSGAMSDPIDGARSTGNGVTAKREAAILSFEGLTFFGALGSLMVFLLLGSSPFRAVTYSLAFVMAMIFINPRTSASLSERMLGFGVWIVASIVASFVATRGQQLARCNDLGDRRRRSVIGLRFIDLASHDCRRFQYRGQRWHSADRRGGVCRDCDRFGVANRDRHGSASGDHPTGRQQPVLGTAGDYGLFDHSWHGLAICRFLSVAGDGDWASVCRSDIGCTDPGGAPLYFLLRHDGDGHAASCACGLCDCVDCRFGCDGNRDRGVPILVGRFHIAVYVCLPPRALLDGGRRRFTGVFGGIFVGDGGNTGCLGACRRDGRLSIFATGLADAIAFVCSRSVFVVSRSGIPWCIANLGDRFNRRRDFVVRDGRKLPFVQANRGRCGSVADGFGHLPLTGVTRPSGILPSATSSSHSSISGHESASVPKSAIFK